MPRLTLLVALALTVLAPPARALTTYCVDSMTELRSAINEAAATDDTVWIRIERGSYLLAAPIFYDGIYDRELQVLGGYGNNCVGKTTDPADTVIFYVSPSVAASAGLDVQFRTWGRLVVRSLTFRKIDDVHVILKGEDAEVLITSNRFEETGGLSIDAHYIGGDAALDTTIEVRNNVIVDTPYEDGLFIRTGESGIVRVQYNTILSSAGDNLHVENDWRTNSIRVSSNIFRGDSVSDVDFVDAYFHFDRNIYRDVDFDMYCEGWPYSICYYSPLETNYKNADPDLDADGKPGSGSPAIDHGEHTGTPAFISYDIVGEPRFQGDRTDIGAYEVE